MAEKTELEKQMEALMAGASVANESAKDAQKSAAKTRRKSRDLEAMFEDLPSAAQWEGLLGLVEDKSDAGIRKLFQEIDTDNSNSIDRDELKKALSDVSKKSGKNLSDDAIGKQVDDMFADAGKKTANAIDCNDFVEMMQASKTKKK